MDERLKTNVIQILVLLTLIFLLVSINSCSSARKYKIAREQERQSRFNIEERLSLLTQDKAQLEEKLKKAEKDCQDLKASFEASNKSLSEAGQQNESLKEELLKVTKLKEKFEEDLKEILVENKRLRK